MKKLKKQFTLIEIIVAVFLLAMLVTTLMGVSGAITISWKKSFIHDRVFTELMALERIYDNAVENAIPFTWRDDERREFNCFMGVSDNVIFAYRHEINSLEDGGIRFISFLLEGDKLVVYYRSRPFSDYEFFYEDARKSQLAIGVEEVVFQYGAYDNNDELIWVDEWNEERMDIPLAIWMHVKWKAGRGEHFLCRTAASGRYERMGLWKPYEEMN
ncbi:MAG: type II secretion system protein [Verrucomicrobiota bacterium]|nr:type II secretion system protein [Verrucomicrobiota bacterium]